MDPELTKRQRLESAVVAGMARAEQSVMRWGTDDCSLWVADILRDGLGYDAAKSFRGRYRTRRGAQRLLKKGGLPSVLRAAARHHKWKRIHPTMAQPGDIGLVWTVFDGKATLAMAVCRRRGWFVARNEKGWTAITAEDIPIAWSVLDDCEIGSRRNLHSQIKLVPQPVHEPVSTFIGLTALISGGLGVSTAIGSFLVSTALSIGFSLLSSMLQPQTGRGQIGNGLDNTQQGVQVTERQPTPSQQVIVGNAYVGLKLFFEQVKPPYLTTGGMISRGQISGLRSLTLGTDRLYFSDAFSHNSIVTPLTVGGQPPYGSYCQFCFRDGRAGQTPDSLIVSGYNFVGTGFRQQGIATITARYYYGGDQTQYLEVWGQTPRPNLYASADGVACYDPRDPLQIMGDETTWRFTNNASLVQAWYLTRDFGGRIPLSKINWSKVADAADYDDELVGCKDGTLIKRYTIDGVIILNEKPFSVLPRLLSANRGYVIEANGKVWVTSSRPRDPLFTIHDGLIVGGFTYQAAKAKRDLINKGQVRFIAEEQEYQLADGPINDRTDLQALDEEVLVGTLSLDFTRDHRRAQRLLKAYIDSSRLGKTIQLSISANALAIAQDDIIGNVVNVDSALWPTMNGTYLVTGLGLSDDLQTLSLALVEYDADIERDWTPAADEKDFTLASINVS